MAVKLSNFLSTTYTGPQGPQGPQGSTGPQGPSSMSDGTATAPGLPFAANTATGFYRPAANTIAISTAGSERMRIDSTGRMNVANMTISANVDNSGTGYMMMPVGTTAQRPASAQSGMYRMNSTTCEPEWYDAGLGNWIAFRAERVFSADFLVVAGGGGFSYSTGYYGGGGGGGGARSSVSPTGGGGSAESPLTLSVATAYTVTVGAGGASGAGVGNGFNGSNSVFSTITSSGGGGGGRNDFAGNDGGSGGGAGGNDTARSGGTGTANQGFAGGSVAAGNGAAGAGGGGAGAVGLTRASQVLGGAGGAGIQNSISGSAIYYSAGAGGAGGYDPPTAGANGTGWSATANRGHGADRINTTGFSGVVIIKYPDTLTITNSGGGLTFSTTTSGGYKVTTFTAGTGTIQFS